MNDSQWPFYKNKIPEIGENQDYIIIILVAVKPANIISLEANSLVILSAISETFWVFIQSFF